MLLVILNIVTVLEENNKRKHKIFKISNHGLLTKSQQEMGVAKEEFKVLISPKGCFPQVVDVSLHSLVHTGAV